MKTPKEFSQFVKELLKTGFTAKDIFFNKAIQDYYCFLTGTNYADISKDNGESYRRLHKFINENEKKFFEKTQARSDKTIEQLVGEFKPNQKKEAPAKEAKQEVKEKIDKNFDKIKQTQETSIVDNGNEIYDFVKNIVNLRATTTSGESTNLIVASLSRALRTICNSGEGIAGDKFKTLQQHIDSTFNFVINLQREENERVKTQAILAKMQADSDFSRARTQQIKEASDNDDGEIKIGGLEVKNV